ncbi:MAG: hypothetical protein GY749_48160 [Desulfobacteraceae bacterium]|nr:hypothetical protein [Desulfobacteraceae bacterium]
MATATEDKRTCSINAQEVLKALDKKAYYEAHLDCKLAPKSDNTGDCNNIPCCFHEDKNGSLCVNTETGKFHCFGCGAGGGLFNFHMEKHGCKFVDALKAVARFAGMEVPEHPKIKTLPEKWQQALSTSITPDAMAYLEKRGFDTEDVRLIQSQEKIGFNPEAFIGKDSKGKNIFAPAICFPMLKNNHIAGIQNIFLQKHEVFNADGIPGMEDKRHERGSKPSEASFIINATDDDCNKMPVTESVLDALSCWKALNFNANCIAIFSTSHAKRLADDDFKTVMGDRKPVLCFDNDQAGGKATKKALKILDECGVLDWKNTGKYKDCNEILMAGRPELIAKAVNDAPNQKVPEMPAAIQESIEAAKQDTRPGILIQGGNLPTEVDFAQDVIRQHGGIYERGGMLFQVVQVRNAVKKKKGKKKNSIELKRSPDTLILQPVEADFLKLHLCRKIKFQKIKNTNLGMIIADCNCPSELVTALLSNKNGWDMPYIAGILETPTITPEGRIISENGYDEETGLVLMTDIVVDVPENPTKEDAQKALAIITDILSEYRFESTLDKAVAISAIMSGIIHRLMPGMPFFAFDAPKPRSGKSLLCDCISIIARGMNVSAFDWPKNDDREATKMVDSILYEGDSVVMLDNIETTVSNSKLCSVATQELIGIRILGMTKKVTVPSNSLWLHNGNNLRYSGDITTRVLPCRINPMCERPEERTFKKSDLKLFCLENRDKIVSAILTVIKAYIIADESEKPKVKPYDSAFQDWDHMIRRPIIWLGVDDVVIAKESLLRDDDKSNKIKNLLNAWDTAGFTAGVTVKKALIKAEKDMALPEADRQHEDLYDALCDCADDGMLNVKKIGNFISSIKGRIEDGKFFAEDGNYRNTKKSKRWKVVTVANTVQDGGFVQTPPNPNPTQCTEYKEDNYTVGGLGGFNLQTGARKEQKKICSEEENKKEKKVVKDSEGIQDKPPQTPHSEDNLLKPQIKNRCGGLSNPPAEQYQYCENYGCKEMLIPHPVTGALICYECSPPE